MILLAASSLSVAAHGLVLAVAAGTFSFDLPLPTQADEAEFTITLQQLDSDTLAGLIAQDGLAGVDGPASPGLEETTPNAVDTEDGEEIAALEPETAPALPKDSPEPATAESVEDPVPEEVVTPTEVEDIAPVQDVESLEPATDVPALESETIEATPELETVTPLPEVETVTAAPDPETVGLATTEPETTAPLRPAPEVAAPVSNNPLISERPTALLPETVETVAPVATRVPPVGQSDAGADVVALLPRDTITSVTPPIERIAPSTETPDRTVARVTPRAEPNRPRPAAVTPPSAQDLAIGELLGRIRASPSYDCLIALPRKDGDTGVGLALIAASDREISEFVDTVLTAEDADIRQTRNFVDPRQCPALTFVRQNRDYPATRLGILLQRNEVESGERITGRVRGTAGKYVVLLLVDSNGVVQDLRRFVTFTGNTANFNVPVNRDGFARDTSQLLLAIATQSPLTQISDRSGQLAQDVFRDLEGELATGAALTIATFEVR